MEKEHGKEPVELRLPPDALEAEQCVLGALLLENSAWDRIADPVAAHDFYRWDHRVIFQHIVSLINSGKPADVITVHDSLSMVGKVGEVGGLGYLNSLAQNTPSSANIRHYAEKVRDRAIMRKVLSVCDEIAASMHRPGGRAVRDLLDVAEAKILAIGDESSRQSSGFLELQPVLHQVVEHIDELYNRDGDGQITGAPTGICDLDNMLSGLQPCDLILVAGKPSMGKTSLAMNIGENVAIGSGLPVAVFSMEMSAVQLATRMIGAVGRIDQQRLRSGRLIDDDWPRMTDGIKKLTGLPIFSNAQTNARVRSS